MKKYYTNTEIGQIYSERSDPKVVERMIEEIQKEHPNAILHSVQQSAYAAVDGRSQQITRLITVIMEEDVER